MLQGLHHRYFNHIFEYSQIVSAVTLRWVLKVMFLFWTQWFIQRYHTCIYWVFYNTCASHSEFWCYRQTGVAGKQVETICVFGSFRAVIWFISIISTHVLFTPMLSIICYIIYIWSSFKLHCPNYNNNNKDSLKYTSISDKRFHWGAHTLLCYLSVKKMPEMANDNWQLRSRVCTNSTWLAKEWPTSCLEKSSNEISLSGSPSRYIH